MAVAIARIPSAERTNAWMRLSSRAAIASSPWLPTVGDTVPMSDAPADSRRPRRPAMLDPREAEELPGGVDAALWADSPANTLPGALWRLYALREWVRRDPSIIAERYRLGLHAAQVHDVVAGVASPPGPAEVVEGLDAVLSGVYAGELDVALERGAAFCRVLATGAAFDADYVEGVDEEVADAITRRASSMVRTADELEQAAALWRAGRLE